MSWVFHIILFFLTGGLGNLIYFLFFREKPISGGERVTPVSYSPTLSSTNFQSSAMANYNRILNRHLAGGEKTNNAPVIAAEAQTAADRKSYEEEQRKLTVGNSGGIGGDVLRDAGKSILGKHNLARSPKNEVFTYRCFECSRSHRYSARREMVLCPCGKPMQRQY
jgi:hypothetical protein